VVMAVGGCTGVATGTATGVGSFSSTVRTTGVGTGSGAATAWGTGLAWVSGWVGAEVTAGGGAATTTGRESRGWAAWANCAVPASGVLASVWAAGSSSMASDRPKRWRPGLLMACGLALSTALLSAEELRSVVFRKICTVMLCAVFCTEENKTLCSGQYRLATQSSPK
jgi:hypothetical protein